MPISPKYEWQETATTLEVRVDIKGLSRAKAEVFATDALLKVNCLPYLLLLDLAHDVDDAQSAATLSTEGVTFKLVKRSAGIWGSLLAAGERDIIVKRRNESIDRAYKRLEEARLARLARKEQEDKAATHRMIEVDRKKRAEIEARKAAELAAERAGLDEWQQRLHGQQGDESDYEDEGNGGEGEEVGLQQAELTADSGAAASSSSQKAGNSTMPDHPDYHGRGYRSKNAAVKKPAATNGPDLSGKHAATITDDDIASSDADDDRDQDAEQAGASVGSSRGRDGVHGEDDSEGAEQVTFKPLPPPRQKLEAVQVSFTKLETGHLPAREQREVEIRQYKKKTKDHAMIADSTDIADRQPLFLKDKGDALFKQANYRGAINAYSRAIELDDMLVTAYSNRAAAHLKLGQVRDAEDDCTRVLELMAGRKERLASGEVEPAAAEPLRKALLRAHVRRAQARAQTGLLQEALDDYEEAIRLAPSSQADQLRSDRDELAACAAPVGVSELRARGDARFRAGDAEGAAEVFGVLIALPRHMAPEAERQASYANRAACYLLLERYLQAVADCNAALGLLMGTLEYQAAADSALLESWIDRLGAPSMQDVLQGRYGCTIIPTQSSSEEEPVGTGEASSSPSSSSGAVGSSSVDVGRAAASAARLLARRGAAQGHIQQFAAGAADYRLAARLTALLMDQAPRVTPLLQDAERLAALAGGRLAAPVRPDPVAAHDSTCTVGAGAGPGADADAAVHVHVSRETQQPQIGQASMSSGQETGVAGDGVKDKGAQGSLPSSAEVALTAHADCGADLHVGANEDGGHGVQGSLLEDIDD